MDKNDEDGRLDPHTLDATVKRKPCKKRKRPEPPQELKEWAKGAEKRARSRPYPPGVILEPLGFDDELWTSPHSDVDIWTLQLAEAFGTRSSAVMTTFLRQLEALCGKRIWDEDAHQWRLDEHEFCALLAMVANVKPRNELEAALAAQMVAVHLMQMRASARALKYDGDAKTMAVAGRLAQTYVMQLEALQRLRKPNRTAKQSIKVSKELHQHVHYHGTRGESKSSNQCHATGAALPTELPTLPSPDPQGDRVPLSSREREAQMQNARRNKSGRSRRQGER